MTDADVENALRTVRPIKVVAVLDDDREVAIAIPRGTRRWERMATTLSSQPWSEIRFFDKANALMAPPLVREPTNRPAAGLEDLGASVPSSTTGALDHLVVERIVRSTMDVAMRSFVEVAKVMRSSGSAEVTAALSANRETVNALGRFAEDLRQQVADRDATIADLERELAARMAAERPPQPEQSASERLIENFASGFLDGGKARDAATKPAEG